MGWTLLDENATMVVVIYLTDELQGRDGSISLCFRMGINSTKAFSNEGAEARNAKGVQTAGEITGITSEVDGRDSERLCGLTIDGTVVNEHKTRSI